MPDAASPRGVALETARRSLGLSLAELWVDYVGLGGALLLPAIAAMLHDEVEVDDHNHDLLVQALNEHFLERFAYHPLPYAEELE